ncbi:MAG: hypothetical protein WD708_07825 [Kiritimatiellia bacterium]
MRGSAPESVRVLIDVHTPPGGITGRKTMRLFGEGAFQESLIRNWEKIARRYKDHPAVWGCDLLNEPIEGLRITVPIAI